MTSIFEFVKQQKETPQIKIEKDSTTKPSHSIFEAAKNLPSEKTPPTRIQSLTGAPIKGYLKGAQESSEFSLLPRGPIPSELQKRAIEEYIPTENRAPERFLEKAGKVASYLSSPGKIVPKLVRGSIATLGSQLAKEFGLPESAQSAIEIGALLTPTKLRGAQKYVSSLFSEAEKIAGTDKIGAKNLIGNVNNFIANITKGGPAASKNAAVAQANAILHKVEKGKIPVKELTEFKKTINEARSSLYNDQNLDRGSRRTAKKHLDDISKVIDNALGEYGKINPEWEKVYRPANEGFGAIASSKKVSNWIGRVIKQHPHTAGATIAGTLIGHALHPTTAIVSGAAIGAGAGLLKGSELLARIFKSKTLRKYYKEAIQSAVKENTAGFLNNLKKLSKAFDSEKNEDQSQSVSAI